MDLKICSPALSRPLNRRLLSLFFLLVFLLAQPAIAETPADQAPVLDLERIIYWDFSGSWEKDFARSDNWMDELKRVIEQQRAEAERRQRREADLRYRQSSPFTLGGGRSSSGAALVDLARLAEYISRQSTMRIVQTRDAVRIERDGEAPLICGLGSAATRTFSSPHGEEICGWDRQYLFFRITLPGNLVINHRFNLAPDSQSLRMVTSVASKRSEPFNLIQTFVRYEEPGNEIDCVQTVSRGRVCQLGGVEEQP